MRTKQDLWCWMHFTAQMRLNLPLHYLNNIRAVWMSCLLQVRNYRIGSKTLIVDIQQMNPAGKNCHFDKWKALPEARNGNGVNKQPSISGCHLCLGQRRRRFTVLPQWRREEDKRSETHRETFCPLSASVLAAREVWCEMWLSYVFLHSVSRRS